MRKVYWLFIAFIGFNTAAFGQGQDSTQWSYHLEFMAGGVGATESYLPHYLVFNRWGIVAEEQNAFVGGQGGASYAWGNDWAVSSGINFRNTRFADLYAQLKFKDWYLVVGKKQQFYGGLPTDLSTGSLGLGPNAQPVPMIEIRLDEFKNVPFTRGYLKFKGNFGHRWLESDRYISGAMVHSKSFTALVDLDKEIGFQISSSIIHFAMYGGSSPKGEVQPSTFSDYTRVVMGKGIANPNGLLIGGETNALGSHLGLTEISFMKRIGEHWIRFNYQNQFEDGRSMNYIVPTDYLMSLEWTLPKKGIVTKARVEVLQSKNQGGPGLPDRTGEFQTDEDQDGHKYGGRDDYYNNWLYRSGWTYKGVTMGNSLFLTHSRTLNYLNPYPDYGVAIANSRINAVHLGVEGYFSDIIAYRLMFTHANNFGTHAGLYEGRFNWEGVKTDPDFDYVFKGGKRQNYSLFALDFEQPFTDLPFNFHLMMAYDFGELYKNFGAELSISYDLFER